MIKKIIEYIRNECGTDTRDYQQYNDIIENGLNRSNFPEECMGEIAKDKWNETDFKYGMEYGYILALVDIFGEEILNE